MAERMPARIASSVFLPGAMTVGRIAASTSGSFAVWAWSDSAMSRGPGKIDAALEHARRVDEIDGHGGADADDHGRIGMGQGVRGQCGQHAVDADLLGLVHRHVQRNVAKLVEVEHPFRRDPSPTPRSADRRAGSRWRRPTKTRGISLHAPA